jgi:hypothetical protein
MRQDPLVISWTILCDSEEALRRAAEVLRTETNPERVAVDQKKSVPGGVEVLSQESHRLGDYFREIQVLPSEKGPLACRVVFHRRPNAGRPWKDLMARVLQAVQNRAGDAVVLRDTQPESSSPREVG